MLRHLSQAAKIDNALQLFQLHFLSTLIFLTLAIVAYLTFQSNPTKLDLVNPPKKLELTSTRVKRNFAKDAYTTIMHQFAKAPGKPFRVIADIGEVTILPPEFANEIRNDSRFSFTKAAYQWFYSHLPGMEGFRAGTNETHLMKLVARHQLTHQLTKVTKAVSDECIAALKDVYTDDEEWHEIAIKEANLKILARVSSRVFLGEELCRNPDWLEVTSTYAVVAFRAVEELRMWPAWLHSIVIWFLPNCSTARVLVQRSRDIINPVLDKRRIAKAAAVASGKSVDFNDAMSWLEDLAQANSIKYDPVDAQLSLSTAALHSTTDLFTQVLLDIIEDQSLIDALRDEIISVLGQGSWNKNSLYKLQLMDSVLKESQRLKPIAIASMRRFTVDDVNLGKGIKIPKGTFTLVSAHRHWDEKHYENPNTFDGYRFLKMRQRPGFENKAQFVSATTEHMGFGYGLHACPGRFFASEEVKIALSHILMNYELKFIPGCDIKPRRFGFSLLANPIARIAIRKRK